MKFLKSPERLFHLGMWMVSILFAGFLMGLGAKVIEDLPRVEQVRTIEDVVDQKAQARLLDELKVARQALSDISRQVADAQAQLQSRSAAADAARRQHRDWLALRGVTSSNPDVVSQDDELRQKTAALEEASIQEQESRAAFQKAQEQERLTVRRMAETERNLAALRSAAAPALAQEQREQETKIFMMRLALTLPLLAAAIWLIRNRRQSAHWPLMRGFVLFAGYAFFFELVPYLPSWGGYVRHVIGVVLTAAAGHWGIRWMQSYLVRRLEQEARDERDRRQSIDSAAAIGKILAGVCPGCERLIAQSGKDHEVNHCVHCGLQLFNRCDAPVDRVDGNETPCGVRKNAFFKHCPQCGAVSGRRSELTPAEPSGIEANAFSTAA